MWSIEIIPPLPRINTTQIHIILNTVKTNETGSYKTDKVISNTD